MSKRTKKDAYAEAKSYYDVAVEDLLKYCEKETDLTAVIQDEDYPFCVRFIPICSSPSLGMRMWTRTERSTT